MVRKTIGGTPAAAEKEGEETEETFDYAPLIDPGMTLLKFGRSGKPHERLFKLSNNKRYLRYYSGWFSPKLGAKCTIDLEKVTRITQGQTTYQFQRWTSIYGEASEKSFSVIYLTSDNEERTLDLIAPSPDIFNMWHGGLQSLVKALQEQRENFSLDALFLKSLWDRADSDDSGTLTIREVVQLVASINVNLPAEKIKNMYKSFDTDQNGLLDFNEFIEFMNYLRKRPDIEAIWEAIVTGNALPHTSEPLPINMEAFPSVDAVISLEQFINFWADFQGEKLDPDAARELVESCNSTMADTAKEIAKKYSDASNNKYLISYARFANVMKNYTRCGLFNPSKAIEYQDMTQPLPYYYMASSHNTYLEGDQLTSFSSVKRYINDLLLGCRCVELDCWDGDDGVPIIFHGHTMTGKILFKDVIKAINEYGFVTSPYPIVLSIENHCTYDQQGIMAKMMKEILQEKLALPMEETENRNIPSPKELMYKVLIKGKRAKEADLMDDDEEDDDDDEKEGKESQSAKAPSPKRESTIKRAMSSKKTMKPKHHPDLSAITYLGTGKVKDFTPEISNSIPCDMMASYAEGKVNKHVKSEEKTNGWIEHNKNHLSRVYPKGTRIDSSNYMPVPAWSAGCQLVALNYQTGDLPYHVNFGKFLENGKTGYVLKPPYLLNGTAADKMPPVRLTINVISASHLPKPGGAQKGEIIDPFVTIYISGPNENQEVKTRTIQDNGFNPVWNQSFSFDIQSPDMTSVTFYVNDEDVLSAEFIAFSSIPVNCLKTGFRCVRLYNANGKTDQDFEYTSLFVRVSMDPIV